MTSRNSKIFIAVLGFSILILWSLYLKLDSRAYNKTHLLQLPLDSREAMEQDRFTALHIAAVTYGQEYVHHTLNIMKTILLLTKSNLNWYVFTTDNSPEYIKNEIEKWPEQFQKRVKVFEAPMICNQWLAFMKTSLNKLRGMGIKPCVLCSFDKTMIKNYTDKFIYLDLDILPVDDLTRAWGIFSTFNDEHIMAMSRADIRYIRKNFSVYDARYGLNSGVIFVNIKNMAGLDFETKYVQCAKETYHYDYIEGVRSADDQDVLNVYFYKYPYQALPVGCNWNYRNSMERCLPGHLYNCDEAKVLGVSILHATQPMLLETGHFNPLYNCSRKIDLDYINETVKCFRDGISYFYKMRSIKCDHHNHYLRPLQITLQKYYPE